MDNLYDNRVNQIKSFLKKPMTLIIGLMFFLSALVTSVTAVVDYINSFYVFSDSSDDFIANLIFFLAFIFLGLLNILPAISFFMFYFKSRTSASNTNFSAPASITTTFSIICISLTVLFCILLILCLCFAIILPFFIFAAIAIIAIMLVTAPSLLVYFSSMLLAARSIVKSCNTTYIKKWQMTFFGIMSTLFSAIFLIAFALVLQDQAPCIFSGDLTSNEIFEQFSFLVMLFSIFLTNLFLSIWSFSYVKFANRTNAAIRYCNYSYCQTFCNGGRQN